MDIADKIRKLLRLAKGREEEPEGQTALGLANELMEEHGVQVDLDDEVGEDVSEDWIVQAPKPVAWMEMLLVALCDILYGGVVMPMTSPTHWRLYVVSERDSIDVRSLAEHFAFLQAQIETIASDFEQMLVDEDKYTEQKVESFTLGVNYGVTEMLFEDIAGRLPTEEEVPFIHHSKALAADTAHEDLAAFSSNLAIDSFKRQVDANNEIFRRTAPENPDPKREVIEIQPDWRYFEQGRKAAHFNIDDVFPDDHWEEPRPGQT